MKRRRASQIQTVPSSYPNTLSPTAVKIDPKERKIVIDEEIEDQLLDDLQYELPDQSPRYVIYQFTHTHPDGRKSVPLVFIFLSPAGMSSLPVKIMALLGLNVNHRIMM